VRDLTCAELVELVSAYLNDELDPATAQRVVVHVAGCPGCGPYVEQYRETIRLLGTGSPSPPDPELREGLIARFRAR
jgi:anti-sigma factor RsiW